MNCLLKVVDSWTKHRAKLASFHCVSPGQVEELNLSARPRIALMANYTNRSFTLQIDQFAQNNNRCNEGDYLENVYYIMHA